MSNNRYRLEITFELDTNSTEEHTTHSKVFKMIEELIEQNKIMGSSLCITKRIDYGYDEE